jgi:hypothetical protein
MTAIPATQRGYGEPRSSNDLEPDPYVGRVWPSALEASATPQLRSPQSHRSTPGVPGEQSGDAARVAASRATSLIRRFIVGNDLDALLTVTLDSDGCVARTKVLLKNALRQARRAQDLAFPYVWVPERANKTGRLHVHLVTRMLSAQRLAEFWQLGMTRLDLVDTVEDRRALATYLAKDFESLVPGFQSRYSPSRGFGIEAIEITAASPREFIERAGAVLGWGLPNYEVMPGPGRHTVFAQWPDSLSNNLDSEK